jgi:hypothetical protein
VSDQEERRELLTASDVGDGDFERVRSFRAMRGADGNSQDRRERELSKRAHTGLLDGEDGE